MAREKKIQKDFPDLEHLRTKLTRHQRDAAVLTSFLDDLTLANSTTDVLRPLLDHIQNLIGATMVVVLEERAEALLVLAAEPELDDPAPAVLPLIEGLAHPNRNVTDLATGRLAALTAHGVFSGVNSLASAAIILGGDRKGVLLGLSQGQNAFDDRDRANLQRFAQLAGQKLDALTARSENQLMAAAVDGAATGVAIADVRRPDKPLTYINRAFELMTGYSKEEVLDRNCRFLNVEPVDSLERARLRETIARNGAGRFILRNQRKNGELFWNELTIYPIYGADGRPEHLVATQNDVSERIEALRNNERMERRLEVALAHSDDAFLMLSPEGTVLLANAMTNEIFRSPSLNWAIGTDFKNNWANYLASIPESIRPTDPQFVSPDFAALTQAKDGLETLLPDGRSILVRAQRTSDGSLVIGATDVTSLKSVERMLRQRVAAIESAPDGIAVADGDNRIIYANSSMANLLDAPSELSLIGRRWASHYKSEDAKTTIANEAGSFDGNGKLDLRLPFQGRSGVPRVHDVSLSRMAGVGLILVIRDVTDQLQAARLRAELDDQLAQARREQSIAQLSAGLAHDFNNLLSAINGSALLISTDENVAPETRRLADRVISAGTQAARLVNRLLDMGRTTEEESLFDLRAAIEDGLSLAKTNLSSATELNFINAPDVLEVHGGPTEASQIVINLVLNSHHALNGARGRIDVALDLFEGQSADNVMVGKIDPNRSYARLSVSDTGSGIPPNVINKIFDPYFSTKGEKGTGIGLASISAIQKRVNGAIAVHSVLGEGTRFDVFWPVGGKASSEGGPENDRGKVDLSGRLVMVVDDEFDVAEVLGSYLERMGAEVAVVDDPELAIEAVQDDPSAWSAIISDYSMGKMTGGDLVEKVRKLTPDLPIFILTALARTISDPRINDQSVQSVFAKPANFRQISVELANILPATSGTSK